MQSCDGREMQVKDEDDEHGVIQESYPHWQMHVGADHLSFCGDSRSFMVRHPAIGEMSTLWAINISMGRESTLKVGHMCTVGTS